METLWSGGVSFALEMPVNGQQCVGYVDIYNDGVVWVGAPNLNGSGNNVGAYCVDLSTAIDWLSDCWREQRFRWRA